MEKNRSYLNSQILMLLVLLSLLLVSSPAIAHTRWVEGVVTKSPWQERYRYIEIDGKLYTFMPEATLALSKKNRNGNYDQEYVQWHRIKEGQKVLIDIQGRRIYHLIIQK